MSREFKDSGIEWIGQIPKEWNLKRFQSQVIEIKEKNSPIKTNFILSLTINDGVIPYEEKGNVGNISKDNHDEYKLAYPNTIVLNSMNILIGAVGICNYYGCVSPVYYVFKNVDSSDLRFLNYILSSPPFQKYLRKFANGILEIRLRISSSDILKQSIPIPPLSEQQKIADYLDKVCGEADEMITLQEKMIEELKAYKQSVITETVTKGLNPNVPMKDSGIDWIGEIPEHWGTPSISYLTSISSGSTPDRNNPLYWYDGTINWIKTGELQNNVICSSEEKVTDDALRETSIKLYPKNTILMAMYGQGKTRGMTALLGVPCTTNQACAALIIRNSSVTVKYLWKCLMAAYDAIRDKAVGTGQPNLNIELISKFIIPLPPVNEQNAIVERIDKVVPSIESLIAVKQQKIEELKEYKKSVIYEYVTGKKEIQYGD